VKPTYKLWNLIDKYNPDVFIGLKKILVKVKSSGMIVRLSAHGGGIFMCVKNIIDSTELWVGDDFEMIAVEVKGMDPKYEYTWEIIGIYIAPNKDTLMLATGRLAARTLPT
jgi:hypothetical protein